MLDPAGAVIEDKVTNLVCTAVGSNPAVDMLWTHNDAEVRLSLVLLRF